VCSFVHCTAVCSFVHYTAVCSFVHYTAVCRFVHYTAVPQLKLLKYFFVSWVACFLLWDGSSYTAVGLSEDSNFCVQSRNRRCTINSSNVALLAFGLYIAAAISNTSHSQNAPSIWEDFGSALPFQTRLTHRTHLAFGGTLDRHCHFKHASFKQRLSTTAKRARLTGKGSRSTAVLLH
jgi:hypothetical protein